MAQNTVQDTSALYVKDVIVYQAPYIENPTDDSTSSIDGAPWVNMGCLVEANREAAKESSEPTTFNCDADNVITVEQETINVNIAELSADNIQRMMGSNLAFKKVVAGTPVVGATQTESSGDWGYNDPFKIENQNASGAIISVTSVTGGTDGLLVADTDYFVGQNANGDTIITLIDSTTITTEAQNMVVVYDYTPAAEEQIWEGGADIVDSYMLRFKATMSDGRILMVDYVRVQYSSGGTIQDQDKNSADYKQAPFVLTAKEHPNFTYNDGTTDRKVLKIRRFIAA
jgi:hypothetical protein